MNRQSVIRYFVWVAAGIILVAIIFMGYGILGRLTSSAPSFLHSALTIQRANGTTVSLNVELAVTPAQKAYGLMFRQSLPPDAGMIFVWDTDQPVDFWMKNTYIPLDMLFVRRDGAIVKIATHTRPLTLMPIPSDEPVRGVIEINAGAADRLGVTTGDKVVFPGFSSIP